MFESAEISDHGRSYRYPVCEGAADYYRRFLRSRQIDEKCDEHQDELTDHQTVKTHRDSEETSDGGRHSSRLLLRPEVGEKCAQNASAIHRKRRDHVECSQNQITYCDANDHI